MNMSSSSEETCAFRRDGTRTFSSSLDDVKSKYRELLTPMLGNALEPSRDGRDFNFELILLFRLS